VRLVSTYSRLKRYRPFEICVLGMSSRFSRQDPPPSQSVTMIYFTWHVCGNLKEPWQWTANWMLFSMTSFPLTLFIHASDFSPQLEWIRGSLCTWVWSSTERLCTMSSSCHSSHLVFTVLMLTAAHQQDCWDPGPVSESCTGSLWRTNIHRVTTQYT
jgi:hypothetical protein